MPSWIIDRAARIARDQGWVSPHRLMYQTGITLKQAQMALQEASSQGKIYRGDRGRYYCIYLRSDPFAKSEEKDNYYQKAGYVFPEDRQLHGSGEKISWASWVPAPERALSRSSLDKPTPPTAPAPPSASVVAKATSAPVASTPGSSRTAELRERFGTTLGRWEKDGK